MSKSEPPACAECTAHELKGPDQLWAHSGVSRNGDGFVHLSWNKERGQLSPKDIRQLGLTLLEVAEAAETDACVLKLLMTEVNLDVRAALFFVGQLRKYREDK